MFKLRRYPQTSIRSVWRLKPGQTAELISQNYGGWPLDTKDGRWLIVNQFGESSKKTLNTIVRFDLRTNTPLLELPEIKFDSMQMWADESARKLYIAYNGHLLRLPLPQKRNKK